VLPVCSTASVLMGCPSVELVAEVEAFGVAKRGTGEEQSRAWDLPRPFKRYSGRPRPSNDT
jgi:hypothetical protein